MTKEGNELRCENCSWDFDCWNDRSKCRKPTPPTPAGAGTETPLCDAHEKFLEKPINYAHDWESFARGLETELNSLRRQAEADRATREALKDEIESEREKSRGLGEQILTLHKECTRLESQLASADKDRERMRTARELLERSFRHCLQGILDGDLNESALSGTQKLSKEIAQFI